MKKSMLIILCMTVLALVACGSDEQMLGETEVTNTPVLTNTSTPKPTVTNTPIPTPQMGTLELELSNYEEYIKISSTVNTRTGRAEVEVSSTENYMYIDVVITVQMNFVDTLEQHGTSVEDIKLDENGNATEYIYYNAVGKYKGQNPAISSCSYTILDVRGVVMGYGIATPTPMPLTNTPTPVPSTNTPTPIPEKKVDQSTKLEYIIENGSVVITGVQEGYLTEIEIPKEIEGYPVISIGEAAFKSCSKIISVIIPDTVIRIEDEAFYECSSLVNVEISSSVTYIGDENFGYCKKLKTIVIPDSVTELGSRAFECSGVENVTLSENLTEIKDGSFLLCTGLKSIIIPDSVISIGDAFEECYNLEKVYISDVSIIDGALAFHYCAPEFIETGTYESAIQMMENNQYEQAIELLEKLGDYADSKAMLMECIYQTGINYLSIGKYEEAIDIFTELGDYADSKSQLNNAMEESQKHLKIGSVVCLGSYEQDNITSNGTEAIEWIVLDIKDGKAILLSKYVLDCQPISTGTIVDRTWEDCLLRTWLNEEFYSTAFSEQEKAQVLRTYVEAGSKVSGFFGSDVYDYVFLLSTLEMDEYNLWPAYTKSTATAYAISKGVSMYTYRWDSDCDDDCLIDDYEYPGWWTRSIGYKYERGESVVIGATNHGYYREISEELTAGVRPVICIEVQ